MIKLLSYPRLSCYILLKAWLELYMIFEQWESCELSSRFRSTWFQQWVCHRGTTCLTGQRYHCLAFSICAEFCGEISMLIRSIYTNYLFWVEFQYLSLTIIGLIKFLGHLEPVRVNICWYREGTEKRSSYLIFLVNNVTICIWTIFHTLICWRSLQWSSFITRLSE